MEKYAEFVHEKKVRGIDKKKDNSLGLNQYVEIGNKRRWDRKKKSKLKFGFEFHR